MVSAGLVCGRCLCNARRIRYTTASPTARPPFAPAPRLDNLFFCIWFAPAPRLDNHFCRIRLKIRIEFKHRIRNLFLRQRIFSHPPFKEVRLPRKAYHLHKIKRVCRIIYFIIP